jgi:uncharacterized protein YtpQ (UPF0354 family)
VLTRVATAAFLAALLVTAGCAGDGAAEAESLPQFEDAVVGALTQAGLEPGPTAGSGVRVHQGPNSAVLDLEPAYARYEQSPGDRDEIVAGVVAEAEERLEEGIAQLLLEDVGDNLMPLLKAPFELRTYVFETAQTPFPGRLAVVYAVDREDSFTLVTPTDVGRWGTTLEQVHELALANLLRRTNEEEALLCEPSGDAELCGWASGDGYDATRMIVPGLRRQIVREYGGPAVYAVPMEHVFVALPRELFRGRTEELFRLKVQRDFQTGEGPLSPDVFAERRGELEVLP